MSRYSYESRTSNYSRSSYIEHRSSEIRRTSRGYFEDPDFPAENESVFFSRKPPRPFEWKRPWELFEEPHFFVGGASRLDIKQGMLGDCWLLAAISALTQHKSLMDRVVTMPDYVADNNHPNYTGKLQFSFWQYGEWKPVVIDDRLPTYKGKLVFVHSAEKNEFWSALLEKAYAKMHGSYEALKGGQTGEAFEDFTGGLSESFDLKKSPQNLFNIMQKAERRQALMGCSIAAKAGEIEAKAPQGLVKGHAYTVTGARKVNTKRQMGVELVRVRNPWGNEREWTGPWGDRSLEWEELSDHDKRKLDLTFEDDGEFWMSFEDFKSNFSTLEICMLGTDNAIEGSKISFSSREENGSWRRNITAGGCRNFLDTFHTNPQFRITLEDSDDDHNDLCTVIIALMQKDRRRKTLSNPIKNRTIGFSIYKLSTDQKLRYGDAPLDMDFFQYNASTARSSFINSREVVARYELPPGEYVIIPSTFQKNEEANFLLRMYSEKEHSSYPLRSIATVILEFQRQFVKQRKQGARSHITEDHNMKLEKFRSFFDKLAGEDQEIDAMELHQILTIAFKKEFRLEVARAVVNMYDEDGSGKLGYEEFKQAYLKTKECMKIFQQYDKDYSGSINAYELRQLLADAYPTIRLGIDVIQAINVRFSTGDGKVNLDDYIEIACRIDKFNDVIGRYISKDGRSVNIPIEELLKLGMTM